MVHLLMTVALERLNPDRDETLVREAVSWLDTQSLFFRNCDAAWGAPESADDYLRHMREGNQADFGVFDSGELVAVITVSLEGKGVFNSHLMAKRGASPAVVAQGVSGVLKGLLSEGTFKEGWSWLAAKNYGAKKIVEACGMVRDGVERFKGQSHGRPLLWVRYSVRAT
jgi:hypothetical protein